VGEAAVPPQTHDSGRGRVLPRLLDEVLDLKGSRQLHSVLKRDVVLRHRRCFAPSIHTTAHPIIPLTTVRVIADLAVRRIPGNIDWWKTAIGDHNPVFVALL
jgi:hypothetical protein